MSALDFRKTFARERLLKSRAAGDARLLRTGTSARRSRSGAVLLEVVLALVLFVGAAAILSTAMNSSLQSVERQKRDLHAANLALSVLAEMQMGARSSEPGSAIAFQPPFDQWTAEVTATSVETESGEASNLKRVEVVVRNKEWPTVARFGQIMEIPGTAQAEFKADSSAAEAP